MNQPNKKGSFVKERKKRNNKRRHKSVFFCVGLRIWTQTNKQSFSVRVSHHNGRRRLQWFGHRVLSHSLTYTHIVKPTKLGFFSNLIFIFSTRYW